MRKRSPSQPLEPILLSPAIQNVDRVLKAVAAKEVTVLFVGESGTGKDLLARRLHSLSTRRAQAFVPINCAAIPESLFESELFGHERGAFTGAVQTNRGKIAAAGGGTLFLDEIGELPIAMQAKLLRFLEHRRFMRVGGTTKIHADIRVVCATVRPLEEEVRRGQFRSDLFYRIQLRNVIEQFCLLRSGLRVRAQDLPASIASSRPSELAPHGAKSHRLTIDLRQSLDVIVDEVIRAAVEHEAGNKSRAAARLGIGLRTVQRRLART
jgi:transcriptional regulator with PAS, ATPase and Fis domain